MVSIKTYLNLAVPERHSNFGVQEHVAVVAAVDIVVEPRSVFVCGLCQVLIRSVRVDEKQFHVKVVK